MMKHQTKGNILDYYHLYQKYRSKYLMMGGMLRLDSIGAEEDAPGIDTKTPEQRFTDGLRPYNGNEDRKCQVGFGQKKPCIASNNCWWTQRKHGGLCRRYRVSPRKVWYNPLLGTILAIDKVWWEQHREREDLRRWRHRHKHGDEDESEDDDEYDDEALRRRRGALAGLQRRGEAAAAARMEDKIRQWPKNQLLRMLIPNNDTEPTTYKLESQINDLFEDTDMIVIYWSHEREAKKAADAQGLVIKELKTAKADKAEIDAAVAQLLVCKAAYKAVTGKDHVEVADGVKQTPDYVVLKIENIREEFISSLETIRGKGKGDLTWYEIIDQDDQRYPTGLKDIDLQ